MSDRKTFCAFGAYAVNVVDPAATVLMVLANAGELRNEIKQNKLITLNLNKRLGEVAWDEAILDTVGLNGNGTPKALIQALGLPEGLDGINVLTVGPFFLGPHIGGIYIERNKFYAEIRPILDPTRVLWPDTGRHTYQFMSSASRTDDSISRYHGFHARVIENSGSTKTLLINKPVPVIVVVDFRDRAQCDDPTLLVNEVQDPGRSKGTEPVLTETSNLDDEGAIFLPLMKCAEMNLEPPKEPPGGGGYELVGGRLKKIPSGDD